MNKRDKRDIKILCWSIISFLWIVNHHTMNWLAWGSGLNDRRGLAFKSPAFNRPGPTHFRSDLKLSTLQYDLCKSKEKTREAMNRERACNAIRNNNKPVKYWR